MNDSESRHKLKVFVGSSPHQRLIILLKQFSQISMRDWTLILMYVRADVICGLLRDIYVPDCALIFLRNRTQSEEADLSRPFPWAAPLQPQRQHFIRRAGIHHAGCFPSRLRLFVGLSSAAGRWFQLLTFCCRGAAT